MLKSSDILRHKSLGGLAWRYQAPFGRHFYSFGDVIFISLRIDGEIHVNAFVTVKVVGGISSCNHGEKLEKSEGNNCVFIVSCVLESK